MKSRNLKLGIGSHKNQPFRFSKYETFFHTLQKKNSCQSCVFDTVFHVAGWHSTTRTCAVLVAVATAIRGYSSSAVAILLRFFGWSALTLLSYLVRTSVLYHAVLQVGMKPVSRARVDISYRRRAIWYSRQIWCVLCQLYDSSGYK